MEIEILQGLGFTQAEAKAYLILLETGPTKVGKIIEKSGLQSSTIHNVLHSLIDKGFVNYILKGKMKIYQTTDPKIILKYYKEKEKMFEDLIPQFESRQNLTPQKPQAEIYEGMNGITIMLNKFIENAKSGDEFCFFSVDVPGMNKDIQKFFETYDVKRKAKGLKVRGIANQELRYLYEKRKYVTVKYVDFPIPTNLSICNDKMALLNWEEKPTGILVTSKQLVKSQLDFFNNIWKLAK